jgi:hypothetical protein
MAVLGESDDRGEGLRIDRFCRVIGRVWDDAEEIPWGRVACFCKIGSEDGGG